jgi:hypothetical protein
MQSKKLHTLLLERKQSLAIMTNTLCTIQSFAAVCRTNHYLLTKLIRNLQTDLITDFENPRKILWFDADVPLLGLRVPLCTRQRLYERNSITIIWHRDDAVFRKLTNLLGFGNGRLKT